MTTLQRPAMPPGTGQSFCPSCAHMFYSTDAFDVHRGIRHNHRAEDGQDSGRCATPAEMSRRGLVTKGGRWLTRDDVATHNTIMKAQTARAAR